jgi:hypothetical protein
VWTHEPLNRMAAGLYRNGWLAAAPDFVLSDRFDRIVARRLTPERKSSLAGQVNDGDIETLVCASR